VKGNKKQTTNKQTLPPQNNNKQTNKQKQTQQQKQLQQIVTGNDSCRKRSLALTVTPDWQTHS